MEKYRRYIDLNTFLSYYKKKPSVLYWDVDSKNWTILDKNPIQIDFSFWGNKSKLPNSPFYGI